MTVFELLTASFAAESFQLREDWARRERQLKDRLPVLHRMGSDDFLQVVTLLATAERRRKHFDEGRGDSDAPGISARRRDILRLTVADYETWADRAEDGFVRAARFLYGQKIFRAEELPYRTQLTPLAAILADLGDAAETDGAKQRIARWYWCGVFGELYGGAIETRFARDFPDVVSFVQGGREPTTVQEASFLPGRLTTLRTRNSAAYKGLYALLMRDGGLDFRTGDPIEAQALFEAQIDIHHIFPKAWCEQHGIAWEVYDTIVNKTAISATTNRKIGGRAPSVYLKTVERDAEISPQVMDGILDSHRIAAEHMRDDDFWSFYSARAEALLDSVARAMGKDVPREPSLFHPDVEPEKYDDGPVDWESGGSSEVAAK